MPTSNYTAFDVKTDDGGVETLIPSVTIEVRDITAANPVTGVGAVALSDLTADSNGHVAAGTLPIATGSQVRFAWFRDSDARCGSAVQVTT